MVRYADDFIILCRSEAEAQAALAEVREWVQGAGLRLHPTKTRLVNAGESGGFDFLGYHFERYQNGGGRKWPRKKSLIKLRAAIREKTQRMRSQSLETIIAQINPTLKGWYAYFCQSLPSALESVDGWVRRRLRSILRFRQKRAGISKGRENPEFPNRWFTARGLFSMAEACARRMPSHC
jgi:RNA-directed DNA polymerase